MEKQIAIIDNVQRRTKQAPLQPSEVVTSVIPHRSGLVVSQPLPCDITNALHHVSGYEYNGEQASHFYAVYDRGPGPASRVKVVLKHYRAFNGPQDPTNQRVIQDLRRDILQWKSLTHPNVLPFLGTALRYSDPPRDRQQGRPDPCLVVPFMEQGDLGQFVRRRADADKCGLILGIANGLHYLHTRNPPVFHGHLRETNILIDNDYHPVLADFGLSGLDPVHEQLGLTAQNSVKLVRYIAPEYLYSPLETVNQISPEKGDIWGFGMISYMILAANPPFGNLKSIWAIITAIQAQDLPSIPSNWNELYGGKGAKLVQMMRECWTTKPASRPTMQCLIEKYLCCGL